MSLSEDVQDLAMHCKCGHDGNCVHWRAVKAIRAADTMAEALEQLAKLYETEADYFNPFNVKEVTSSHEALAAYRAATKGEG
jgi:hypothetical protein